MENGINKETRRGFADRGSATPRPRKIYRNSGLFFSSDTLEEKTLWTNLTKT